MREFGFNDESNQPTLKDSVATMFSLGKKQKHVSNAPSDVADSASTESAKPPCAIAERTTPVLVEAVAKPGDQQADSAQNETSRKPLFLRSMTTSTLSPNLRLVRVTLYNSFRRSW